MSTTTDVTCRGCGRTFKGQRGLRSHQSRPYVTIACRPSADDTPADLEHFDTVAVTVTRAEDDAIVVQIDTEPGTGVMRVWLNDGQLFAADSETGR